MADNLSVSVVADTSKLRAQLLLAQTDMRTFGAEARKLASDMRAGAADMTVAPIVLEQFAEKLNAAKASVGELKTALGETRAGAESAAHGIGGVTRELLVLAHEGSQGNFKRLGGSLLVMGELISNKITPATMGWIGAIGAAGFAAYEVIERLHEVESAVRSAQGAQFAIGTLHPGSEAETRAMIKELQTTYRQGLGDATKIVQELRSIGGAASAYQQQLKQLGMDYAEVTKADPAKLFEEIAKAANEGAPGVLKFAQAHQLLRAEVQNLLEPMAKAGDTQGVLNKLVEIAGPRFHQEAQRMREAAKAADEWQRQQQSGAPFGLSADGLKISGLPSPSDQMPRESSAVPIDAQLEQERLTLGKINAEEQKRTELYDQIAQMQDLQNRGVKEAAEAEGKLWRELARTHTESERAVHEVILGDLQQQLIRAKDNGSQRIAIEEKIATEQRRYFSAQSSEAREAANAVVRAEQEAADRRLQIELAVITGKQALARDNLKEVVALEDEKIRLIREHNARAGIGGSGTGDATPAEAAMLAEIRRRESGGKYDTFHATGQHVSSLADVEALPGKSHAFGAYGFQPGTYRGVGGGNDISPAEQDARALALLRQYGPNSTASWAKSGPYNEAAGSGAMTPQLQEALNKKAELVKSEADKETRDKLDELQKQITAETTSVADREKLLGQYNQVYTARLKSSSDEFRRAKDFETQETARIAAQLAQLDLKKLEDQRKVLDEQETADLRHVDRQRQARELSIADAAAKELQIVKTHDDAVAQIIASEEKAAAKIERLRVEVADRAIAESRKEANQRREIADRAADQEAQKWRSINQEIASNASSSLMGMLTGRQTFLQGIEQLGERYTTKALDWALRELLMWGETQTGMTAISGAASATRAAIDDSSVAGFVGRIGKQLAEWVGLETAKTGETAAGAGLRSGIDLAGAALAAKAMIPLAFSEIQMSAAVAAAAAYADSAMMGPPGLAVAPAVAAGTYGVVMGFATGLGAAAIPSAAGGWIVPSGANGVPMIAHENEVTLPAEYRYGLDKVIANADAPAGGGGVNVVNLNVQAMDGQSVHRVLMANVHSVVAAFNKGRRQGSTANLSS